MYNVSCVQQNEESYDCLFPNLLLNDIHFWANWSMSRKCKLVESLKEVSHNERQREEEEKERSRHWFDP